MSSESTPIWQAFDAPLMRGVHELAQHFTTHQLTLSTAESCTGGLIAAHCTELSGSSMWFERGYVTYSNAAKQEALLVPGALIEMHGAVSEPVALAMAAGARSAAQTDWAIGVTGIAGPTGGSDTKPVGTVWLAWAGPNNFLQAQRFQFGESTRQQIRLSSVHAALTGLLQRVRESE
mgnify:FL=1